MINNLPRWEKVLQRNFPPLALTTSAYSEFNGLSLGPLNWIREREIFAKYKTVQMYMIQDPKAFYISNINDLLDKDYPDFEQAIDQENKLVYEGVRLSPGKTLEDLAKLSKWHVRVYGAMVVGFDLTIDIKAKIDSVINNNDSNFQIYLETPIEKTGVEREKEAMQMIQTNFTNEDLEKLVNDFGYLHQDYLGQPWGVTDYSKALSDKIILNKNPEKLIKIEDYSTYEQYLVRMFKKMVYMYEEGRNAMVRACWAMKETVKALGYDAEKLLYMTKQEVELFAANKTPYITDELFKKRQEAFALYFEAGKYYEFTGNEEVWGLIQEQKIEHFWKEEINNETLLKGAIACRGKAVGKVRLVFTQADANQVELGEILVSPMTQVEFLSGIRKCAAIVTDEGGIICHAAIVSREFNKPCLLATGKATKIFKNGDLVEVDADNGIIRILK